MLTEEKLIELDKLLKANVSYYKTPLEAVYDRSHYSTIRAVQHRGGSNYLASGHMDLETARLFVEAVNALPELIKRYRETSINPS